MLYTSLSKKGRKTKIKKRRQRPKTPPLLFSIAFSPDRWERPCPQEGSGGAIWRNLSGPNANFMIRKIFFGLMVLENLL